MDMLRRLLALLGLALAPTAATSPPAAAPPPSGPLPPLTGEWIEPVADLGMVSPPTGATEPRPVVVAIHGLGDRPEWECGAWRAVFGPRPFIVCPHGEAWTVNYRWRSSDHVRAAIDELLDASQARFGAYMDREHAVYAGFSQGAILGARVVRGDPQRFPYVILQEGFPDDLGSPGYAGAYKRGGVRRVLLGCSQGGCVGKRAPIRDVFVRAGVDSRVNYAGNQGHTINEAVFASLRRDLPWLLADDPKWSSVVADLPGGS
jgi:predicted esterase